MDVFVELLKTCIPTIVGALIVIIPTAINKKMEINQKREEQKFQDCRARLPAVPGSRSALTRSFSLALPPGTSSHSCGVWTALPTA